MAIDRNLLKDLKKLREKEAERLKHDKFAIVCLDIFLGQGPFKAWRYTYPARQEQSSGRAYVCETCVKTFQDDLTNGQGWKFKVMRESHVAKKVHDVKDL